jgi:hypothetical protein
MRMVGYKFMRMAKHGLGNGTDNIDQNSVSPVGNKPLGYMIAPTNVISFSRERMTYLRDESKVIYKAKKGGETKTFKSLEWLAAMCSHVPNRGEQMVWNHGSPSKYIIKRLSF